MQARETWLLLRTGANAAAWNMAFDEALLEAAPTVGRPVLRFYAWTEPAASFGYFQRYAEVEQMTPLRPLVRRPTGGGLVPHERDWTYSLAFPPGHPWYHLRARNSYAKTHQWLQRAFGFLGFTTELARARVPGPGQCFVGAEPSDILWRGAKIAGAAQRRNRSGLLIQGSVQPPETAPAREEWERAVCEAASEDWGVAWEAANPDPSLLAQVERAVREKYGRPEFSRRR